MGTPSEISPAETRPKDIAGIAMQVVVLAIGIGVQEIILFLASGQLNWIWPWIYLGICVVTLLILGPFLLRTIPETLAERGRARFTRGWDQVVTALYAFNTVLALPLVAGLDVRFGWTSELGTAWHVAGAVVFVGGMVLVLWAMISNAFFSTAVHIQSERGHTVCRSGPYRFVRHPGYVGFILEWLSLPVLLGSLWALIPGVAVGVVLIIRTPLEDRTLQAELPGYRDYVQETRYRLFPGIW